MAVQHSETHTNKYCLLATCNLDKEMSTSNNIHVLVVGGISLNVTHAQDNTYNTIIIHFIPEACNHMQHWLYSQDGAISADT